MSKMHPRDYIKVGILVQFLLMQFLLMSSLVSAAPVQSSSTVTTSTSSLDVDPSSHQTDHHHHHHHHQEQQQQQQQQQQQPKPTHEVAGCHFKNTEIALPITFSLEMPSYVMVGGHKFNLKLQMPSISHT